MSTPEDFAVLQEIARLSGAINRAKSSSPYPPPPVYAPPRGRGGRGLGRGVRGGAYPSAPPTTHRNASWVAPKVPGGEPTVVVNPVPFVARPGPGVPPVAGRGGFKNRTLVLKDGKPVLPAANVVTSSSSGAAASGAPTVVKNAAGEVVIDGVTFTSDPRGNKLVRKPGPVNTSTSALQPDSSTPKRTSVSGTTYVRTKSGNLVSLDFAKKRKELADKKELAAKKDRLDRLVGIVKGVQGAREEGSSGRGGRGRGRGGRGRGRGSANAFVRPTPKRSSKPCRFFQKTGQCNNGLTCPYIHDSAKVAICPLFLRHSCPHRPSSCLLSHTPNDHRSPHCTHFPNCKNGISCTYSHVHVARDAGVCEEFARYGWCEKGEKCEQRHAFECPEFSERGTCGTLGCKLPHVLRRRNGEGVVEESSDEEDEVERVVVEKEVRRKRRAEEGISGEAGRRLKVAKGLAANEDFVTLFVPLSDEEADDSEEEDDEDDVDEEDEEGVVSDEEDEEGVASDEDDDGMSVESADLEGLQDDDDDELLVGFVDGTERAEGDSHRRPEFVDAEVEDTEVEQLLRS